jgi:hypothetical protein
MQETRDNPHLPFRLRGAPGALRVWGAKHGLRVRLPDEVRAAKEQLPTYAGRGQPRKPRPAPLYSVKELIEAQPTQAWQTIEWREGTKGTMRAQVLAIRVHWATGSQRHSTSHSRVHTGPEGWLLAERCVPAPTSQEPATDELVPQEDTAAQKAAEGQEAEKTKYCFSSLLVHTFLVFVCQRFKQALSPDEGKLAHIPFDIVRQGIVVCSTPKFSVVGKDNLGIAEIIAFGLV